MEPDLSGTPIELPAAVRSQIERLIHDLAQPLTLLQCRLELAAMDLSDPAIVKEAIDRALDDGQRLFDGIKQLRHRLLGEHSYLEL